MAHNMNFITKQTAAGRNLEFTIDTPHLSLYFSGLCPKQTETVNQQQIDGCTIAKHFHTHQKGEVGVGGWRGSS